MGELKEFNEWLYKKCPWFYLLTREQEEEYFEQWLEERKKEKTLV